MVKERLGLGKAGFIQKEEILEVLKSIGSNNPLAALVEFTMSFDPKEVHHVISKLEELKNSVTASLADDAKLEVKAIENYKILMAEMNKVRNSLHSEIAETKAHIKEVKETLAARR